ncbi:hypothetical protein AV530_011692 [Patagioenas fasciata monilis]|uniref:Uncharacterized protein n=1 Tax=Patagioenas fasciata monilis TaxID=372326 RepID=A0A1V4KLF3_PATFA|nr:hypothetical protein AV530_011692 [Patagioenas fasciata monilis]
MFPACTSDQWRGGQQGQLAKSTQSRAWPGPLTQTYQLYLIFLRVGFVTCVFTLLQARSESNPWTWWCLSPHSSFSL